jgi:hypothetical protein
MPCDKDRADIVDPDLWEVIGLDSPTVRLFVQMHIDQVTHVARGRHIPPHLHG